MSFGVLDIWFEMSERFWIGKACGTEQFEVAIDCEASGLIFPIGAVRFDEVTIDENAALRERLITASVHLGHGLLATEVVERPSRDDCARRP